MYKKKMDNLQRVILQRALRISALDSAATEKPKRNTKTKTAATTIINKDNDINNINTNVWFIHGNDGVVFKKESITSTPIVVPRMQLKSGKDMVYSRYKQRFAKQDTHYAYQPSSPSS